jgi:hypothetical protein
MVGVAGAFGEEVADARDAADFGGSVQGAEAVVVAGFQVGTSAATQITLNIPEVPRFPPVAFRLRSGSRPTSVKAHRDVMAKLDRGDRAVRQTTGIEHVERRAPGKLIGHLDQKPAVVFG